MLITLIINLKYCQLPVYCSKILSDTDYSGTQTLLPVLCGYGSLLTALVFTSKLHQQHPL